MNKKKTKESERDGRLIKAGQKLREIRIELGFTSYEAFAWEHGINRVQYWRMENGQNFTLESLFKVLDQMEVKVSEFFKEID